MTAVRPTILLVEAAPEIADPLVAQLGADGYHVALARSPAHALVLAGNAAPALVLLGGLASPRGTLSLLEQLRSASGVRVWDRTVPAIVLGQANEQLELLRAFEAGADDFVGPAASYLELRARVRALLRRLHSECHDAVVEVGELTIDTHAHAVSLSGRAIELRRMEFDLLLHLAREPRRVFAKQELLRAVWGYRACGATRTLDSHASRLRRKLNIDGAARWVINVWGVGYRLT
jgi:DNA-binding response OmpR family regulator